MDSRVTRACSCVNGGIVGPARIGLSHYSRSPQPTAGDGAAVSLAVSSAGPSAARRLWTHGDNPFGRATCRRVRNRAILRTRT